MKVLTRRAVTVGASGMALLALAAGPAAAHGCYKTNLNQKAAQGIAGSANWISFQDLATGFFAAELGVTLCQEGVDYLAEAGGVEPTTLINGHGMMAGGTFLNQDEPGTKSISYLDFDALDAAIPGALDVCGITPPA